MTVLCAHCGEELMGAVNRCWRCGQSVASHSGPLDIPPIRRAPISGPLHTPMDAPLEAMVLVNGANEGKVPTQRRGSPFLPTPAGPSVTVPITPPSQAASYRASSARGAQFAALVSVGVSLLGMVVSRVFPVATVFLSIVAIGLGIWGLFGPQRRVAIFALLFACVGLAWGGFHAAVQIYEMIYKVHPFATSI